MKSLIKIVFLASAMLIAPYLNAQQALQWQGISQKLRAMEVSDSRSIGSLSHYINTSFSTDMERLMAVYFWLGTHIDYDLGSMNKPLTEDTRNQIIANTFNRRKGLCEGYAGLMDTLCQLAGIPVHTIYGFTRQQGRIDEMPHAWNAAFIDGQWYLFDATFASGSLIGRRFVREFDDIWFMVEPDKMIETHMPYDPIWQFLAEPVTYRSFAAGKPKSGLYSQPIAFADSIATQLQFSKKDQYGNELRRIGLNNFSHNAVSYRTEYLREAIRVMETNSKISLFNDATQAFNRAAEYYNTYANRRNQGRLNDSQATRLASLLLEASDELNTLQSKLRLIEKAPTELSRSIRDLKAQAERLEKQVLSELKAIGYKP